MRKYLIIIALSLVSMALSARDVKVSVVLSKTSYAVAESETGGRWQGLDGGGEPGRPSV